MPRHEAVRQWVLRLEGLVLRVRGRVRIVVDEAGPKMAGRRLYAWADVDPVPGGVLAVKASQEDGLGCPRRARASPYP